MMNTVADKFTCVTKLCFYFGVSGRPYRSTLTVQWTYNNQTMDYIIPLVSEDNPNSAQSIFKYTASTYSTYYGQLIFTRQ